MPNLTDQISRGADIASSLAAHHARGDRKAFEEYRNGLDAAAVECLNAFRAEQIASALADVENSADGAQIRRDVAKRVYGELFEQAVRASIAEQS